MPCTLHTKCTLVACSLCARSYLQQPLQHVVSQASASGTTPTILLLLDALDEADDSGQGWPPMARLLAKE